MKVGMRFANWALMAAMAMLAFTPVSWAAEGRVFFTSGGAYIERGAERIPARKDMLVETGDVLVTESDGRLQWRMADDSYMAIRPNSRFKVAEYQSGASKDGSGGRAFYEMLAGGFRNLTGLIGKKDPAAYRVTTPVATMGIRGTDYTTIQTPDGYYVRVDSGAVVITNAAGSLEVQAGQYAFVGANGAAPVLVSAEVGAAIFANWQDDFEFRFAFDSKTSIHERIEPGEIPSPN